MTTIGYARVSTDGQGAGLENQIRLLNDVGCERVFREHVSSVKDHRPELSAMLSYVREGDVLVITSIDRLARNVIDLLTMVDGLRTKGVGVRILNLALDTSTVTGRLTLTVLGAVAEAERTTMLERSRVGIEKAKLDGKYKGRVATARRKAPAVLALAGRLTPVEIAAQVGISRASVYRIIATREAK